MRKNAVKVSKMGLTLCLALLTAVTCQAAAVPPATFSVAAHDSVNTEWWYVNAHVTTDTGRHLALAGSFFQFDSGVNIFTGQPQPRAHYLIYGVTDLDRRTHRSYSLADAPMITLVRQIAPLLASAHPDDPSTQALLTSLKSGKLPAPHQAMGGPVSVVSRPFHLAYGPKNTLAATNDSDTAFALDLDAGGTDKVHLTLSSQKPPMAVGGKGETGLTRPDDMHYFSLTRCVVGGTIDTDSGPEKITAGTGWFDHQWGDSWVAQNDGWDWWGIQLTDGTDILVFRQRNLASGKVFFPLATFMDKNGHQSVTKKIIFKPDPSSLWKNPKTGVRYPLAWTVAFPEEKLTVRITAAVKDQEMPILGPGSAIWEGSCMVTAASTMAHSAFKSPLNGIAYMELVGYNSPAVQAQWLKVQAQWLKKK